jgi:hypothetical protein
MLFTEVEASRVDPLMWVIDHTPRASCHSRYGSSLTASRILYTKQRHRIPIGSQDCPHSRRHYPTDAAGKVDGVVRGLGIGRFGKESSAR